MSLTTEQYEKIIRFLDAEMDAVEMDAFEKELDANPEMRKQLDFEQALRDDFALQDINSLPGTAAAKERTATSSAPGKVTNMRKWLAIAAAAIATILLITIFWQKPEKNPAVTKRNDIDTTQHENNPPQAIVTPAPKTVKDSVAVTNLAALFKQYFKKDPAPEEYPLFLAAAFTDYESGKYTTLQQLDLNKLPQTRGAGETNSKENILKLGHYYKGLAFLQTNNTKETILNLHWVLNNQHDKALRAKAQWYLALAYLKDNNSEKAAALCRSIISNKENDVLVKNAEKILDIVGK